MGQGHGAQTRPRRPHRDGSPVPGAHERDTGLGDPRYMGRVSRKLFQKKRCRERASVNAPARCFRRRVGPGRAEGWGLPRPGRPCSSEFSPLKGR